MIKLKPNIILAGVRKKAFDPESRTWKPHDFYVPMFVYPNIVQAQINPKLPRETYSIANLVCADIQLLDQNGNLLHVSQMDGDIIIG